MLTYTPEKYVHIHTHLKHTCTTHLKHTYIHIHAHLKHTYIHTYIHTYTHTHVHTQTHTHIHTYIHTYIHSHTCTPDSATVGQATRRMILVLDIEEVLHSVVYVRGMSGVCTRYVWCMYAVCLVYVCGMSGVCTRYVCVHVCLFVLV
jgi:hypothetical protein